MKLWGHLSRKQLYRKRPVSPGRKQVEYESTVWGFDKNGQWPPGLPGQESSQQVEGHDRSPLRHLWDHICPYGFEFPGRRKTLASWIESSPAAAWRGGSSTRHAMKGWELSERAQGRPNSNQIREKKSLYKGSHQELAQVTQRSCGVSLYVLPPSLCLGDINSAGQGLNILI